MTDARRFRRAEDLYHAALEHRRDERDRFLAEACGEDQELLHEVKSLLGYAEEARVLLEEPAAAVDTQEVRPDPARWVGRRLGRYEVLSPLGAGGMGEVYRARDTTLGREVALKVLPEAFARGPERVSRFRDEARVLAALNHPNIAVLYGLEEADGQLLLALELVEGETLKERLARGAIPIDEALEIARQIAEGLEAAHDNGIVHRDLKPANVKLTPEGRVKILDFGLAKPYAGSAGAGSAPAVSSSPTAAAESRTEAGIILGTAAYMSPEQASGKPVDKRADVWSFGVLVSEMLTGHPLFAGDTVSEIIASVIKDDPDLDALPPPTPRAVRRLLARCLRKDPRKRLPDIGAARLELEEALAGVEGEATPAEAAGSAPSAIRRQTRERERHQRGWLWAIGGLLIGGLAASAVFMGRPDTPESPPTLHFVYDAPEGFTSAGWGDVPAVCPDGRHLAFTGMQSSTRQLWVRSLDAPDEARRLPGTEGAHFAFWSPDSQWVAFFTHDDLSKARLSDGSVQRICARPPGEAWGGTWGRGGQIVFSNTYGHDPNVGMLFAVSAEGGEARQLTRLDPSRGEASHFFPRFLPDGRHFLFNVRKTRERGWGLFAASLDAPGERRLVLPGTPRALYASGHLLFGRSTTLLAQPFDVETLEVSGRPEPVAWDLPVWRFVPGLAWFGASSSSVLAYHAGEVPDLRLEWLDRKGERLGIVGEPAPYAQIALSPDGRRVAFGRLGQDLPGVWVMEVSRGVTSRLAADLVYASDPVWSPDSQEVVFTSVSADNTVGLSRKDLRAGTPATLVLESRDLWPEDWTRDGTLLYIGGNDSIWALPMAGDGSPERVLKTGSQLDEARLSPDGRWLAYTSEESGTWEVYVQPFRRPGERVRVSVDGGGEPRWRRDGRELFYKSSSRRLMAVEVREDGGRIEVGVPTELFELEEVRGPQLDDYAVTADGQRFLVKVPTGETDTSSIHVVVNWPSLLE